MPPMAVQADKRGKRIKYILVLMIASISHPTHPQPSSIRKKLNPATYKSEHKQYTSYLELVAIRTNDILSFTPVALPRMLRCTVTLHIYSYVTFRL